MKDGDGAETRFWLAAVVGLPVLDVALVVGLNAAGVVAGVSWGYLVGVALALVLSAVTLRSLGARAGVGPGQVAAALGLSLLVALIVVAVLVVGVVAPAVS